MHHRNKDCRKILHDDVLYADEKPAMVNTATCHFAVRQCPVGPFLKLLARALKALKGLSQTSAAALVAGNLAAAL